MTTTPARRILFTLGGVVALVAVAAGLLVLSGEARTAAAQNLYEHAVARYMLNDVNDCEIALRKVARNYPDLALGALAQLKLAFLAYDERGDIEGSRAQFQRYLDDHPESVMYLSRAPLPEYEGELELVAYYYLGRIAQQQGQADVASKWFEKIIQQGSQNPANMIVGETRVLLEH